MFGFLTCSPKHHLWSWMHSQRSFWPKPFVAVHLAKPGSATWRMYSAMPCAGESTRRDKAAAASGFCPRAAAAMTSRRFSTSSTRASIAANFKSQSWAGACSAPGRSWAITTLPTRVSRSAAGWTHPPFLAVLWSTWCFMRCFTCVFRWGEMDIAVSSTPASFARPSGNSPIMSKR